MWKLKQLRQNSDTPIAKKVTKTKTAKKVKPADTDIELELFSQFSAE